MDFALEIVYETGLTSDLELEHSLEQALTAPNYQRMSSLGLNHESLRTQNC